MKHTLISIIDGFVKSQKTLISVIPAKAGIQCFQQVNKRWIPAFAGMTTFCEFVIIGIFFLVTGCTTSVKNDAAWPEQRNLGSNLSAYRPPPHKPFAESSPVVEEPIGALTLRQAVSLALLKNPELAAFAWEVRAGEARTLQAGLLPNPELQTVLEQFQGTGDYRNFESSQTTLQLSQLIPLGGKISKRVKATALKRDLAGWDYEIKRLAVLTKTTKSFITVLAAQKRLDLLKELVGLSEQVLDTVVKKVKAGKVSPLQKSKAQVILSTSRIQLEQTRRNLKAARKLLAVNWGSIFPAFEKVEGQLDALKPVPSADRIYKLLSENPNLAKQDKEVAFRQARLTLEKANRIPDISVQGGMQWYDGTDDSALLLGISIPLQFFDRNQGNVLEAYYALEKSKQGKRAAQTQLHASLAQEYQNLAASYAIALAFKNEVLPAAAGAFTAAGTGYRYGKFSYLQVLDAQRTLFEVRGRYIDALASYHVGVAEVERLIGTGLDKI